jgi:hypothetical protein
VTTLCSEFPWPASNSLFNPLNFFWTCIEFIERSLEFVERDSMNSMHVQKNLRRLDSDLRCDNKDLDTKLTPIEFSEFQLKEKRNSYFLCSFQGYFQRAESEADRTFSGSSETQRHRTTPARIALRADRMSWTRDRTRR